MGGGPRPDTSCGHSAASPAGQSRPSPDRWVASWKSVSSGTRFGAGFFSGSSPSARCLNPGRYLLTGSSLEVLVVRTRGVGSESQAGRYQDSAPFSSRMSPSSVANSFDTEAMRYMDSLVVAGAFDSFARVVPKFFSYRAPSEVTTATDKLWISPSAKREVKNLSTACTPS